MTHFFANRFKPLLPCAVLLAMFFALLLIPEAGWASGQTTIGAASGQFQFAQDDYYINVILKGILGDVINPTSASAGSTVTGNGTLGEVFRTFNMGIAFFGSVIVVFITMVGVLQSGNDGEFLGRKWSSMWVPVRFATGSALMLPLTSSGYSYCQAIVLWIASQGVGFADTLWTTIVNQIGLKDGMVLSKQIDVGSVVKQIALSEICVATLNSIERQAAATVPGSAPGANYQYRLTDTGGTMGQMGINNFISERKITAKWGDDRSLTDTNYAGACGTINYSVNTAANRLSDPYEIIRMNAADEHVKQIDKWQGIFAADAAAIVDKYMITTAAPNTDVNAELKPLFARMFSNMDLATEEYTKVMGDAVQRGLSDSGYKNSTDKSSEDMTKYGFAMAGMWYIEILKAHNTARHSLNSPTIVAPNYDGLGNNPGMQRFNDVISSVKSEFEIDANKKSNNNVSATTSSSTGGSNGATIKVTTTNFSINTNAIVEKGFFDGIFVYMSNWLREAVFGIGQRSNGTANNVTNGGLSPARLWHDQNTTDPNVSAILQLKNKGDTILDAAGMLMAADILAKTIQGGVEAVNQDPVAKTASSAATIFTGGLAFAAKLGAAIMDKLSGYIISSAVGLFIFGIVLSVYIPMIPYILWVGALIGLTILILESLVAIMLWAVMMMHPSGEGITSDYNRQGLNMLLAVFTRPALLLMGMILGMFMVEPMIMFINDTFEIVMTSVQADSITGAFSTIAFIGIYISLVMMVIEKSFAMIHVVPDRVLTWIGGPGALTGEEREMVSKGQSQIATVGQGMNSIMLAKNMQSRSRPKTSDIGSPVKQ